MPALHHIAVEKLHRLIGTPGAPVVIDIRGPTAEVAMIPSSLPRDAGTVADWGASLPGQTAIVVGADGGAAAHATAAWLRSEGVAAEVLEGGFAAWRAADLPLLDVAKLPPRDPHGRTVWVTRARPKVDRIACPWLIRRFVDPTARFLFVAPAQVLAVAERLDAAAFDLAAEGLTWTHRGDGCTFDTLIEELGLGTFPALRTLAPIVRGADTDRLDLAPEAAGLLAVSLGLSRVHADDDVQLEAGMAIYDALYRWARDARAETHDWTAHQPREARA